MNLGRPNQPVISTQFIQGADGKTFQRDLLSFLSLAHKCLNTLAFGESKMG